MPEPTRVYVDMVGDLFHPGHVALLRAARGFGDELVVGVLSDETVASYKRRPVMTMDERVAVIEACRYVDEAIPNTPNRLTREFLAEHNLALIVHVTTGPPMVSQTCTAPSLKRGITAACTARGRDVHHGAHCSGTRLGRGASPSGVTVLADARSSA